MKKFTVRKKRGSGYIIMSKEGKTEDVMPIVFKTRKSAMKFKKNIRR